MDFLFYGCALEAAICGFFAIKMKRRNYGYILLAALLIIQDLVCVMLFSCQNVNKAKDYICGWYILHSLLVCGILYMVTSMSRRKRFILFLVPGMILTVIEIAIIAGNFSGQKNLEFKKVLKMGTTWWVSQPMKGVSGLYSFETFTILMFAMVAFVIALLIACRIQSARQFRRRYDALIVMMVCLASVDVMGTLMVWPCWILTLIMNVCLGIGFYYVNVYSRFKLKDWALISFANSMSDGFVLFDEYGDLNYMNDRVKYSIDHHSIHQLSTINGIKELLEDKKDMYGKEVIAFRNQADTEDIYFNIAEKSLDERGRSVGTIYTLHDTTDSILKLKAMEDANEELERAAKMKADFLANMSHEIRTPMNAVIGMAEIALREKLPPVVADYLIQIQNSGRNLVNIINDILDYSKIEAGKMEIIPERYEPMSELSDIANVLATRIGDKRLELFVVIDPKIPYALKGDAMRIRQIIINLANNAIKFTQKGLVAIVVSSERKSENEVVLTYHVVDTGQGIKSEDIPKLFKSFQQVDSKRNRAVEGTGLGLAICNSLTEAMNGRIGVTSRYGEGSDFYFSVPQEIVDGTPGLVVEDAANKHAFVLNTNNLMLDKFIDEINSLGVSGAIIKSLDEYAPTGKKDYLFFEDYEYSDSIKRFLDEHPELDGVIRVNYDSTFTSRKKNLHVLRRPQTTLNLVSVLNGQEVVYRTKDDKDEFRIDYTAPDARILIVDDNAINVTIAEGLLKPIKAECVGALSGKEAIDRLRKEDFDLVLMDHMMPDMDGIETTKAIRAEVERAKDTPIIALTANVLEGVKDMFLKEGMNDFVAKPVDVKDIITKVKMWLPEDKIRIKTEEELDAEAVDEAAMEAMAEEEHVKKTAWFDGLDNEAAIKGLGTPELFAKIVEEYYRSGRAKHDSIKEAYDTEDWTNYTIRVHALKSSSRQIGAAELGEMAAELEKAGNAQDIDYIRANNAAALDAFDDLLLRLSGYFPDEQSNEDAAEKPEITVEEFEALETELSEACDSLDMDGMEAVKDKLKGFAVPEAAKEALGKLYDAIDDIDTDACMELISELKTHVFGA
ncbi:MAG: response regulator [Lachnospiraceae bacterium]|nr:response regulator [Lachnospiraceae bacterium]